MAMHPRAVMADDFMDDDFMEINVTAGFQSHNIKDMAYDYYSDDDWLTSATLFAEVEVWDELFVGLGFATGQVEDWLFDEWATTLSLFEPQMTVRYGYNYDEWLRPYALAGLTYTITETHVDLWYPHVMGFQQGWKEGTWGGRFALGSEVYVLRDIFGDDREGLFKDFTMGVGVEGGYMLKQSIDLGEIRQGKSGELDEEPP